MKQPGFERAFSLVLLFWLSSHVTHGQAILCPVTPANFDEVDAYISTKMEELGIPGAALVIVQGDQIVHLKAFGVADGDGRPSHSTDAFLHRFDWQVIYRTCHHAIGRSWQTQIGCASANLLALVSRCDPNASELITVRQLLNMDSGIPRSIGQEQIANLDLSDSAIENNVRALAKIDLIAPPGERYEYSNANYTTLGMIIQAVSGQSYETYIREQISNP